MDELDYGECEVKHEDCLTYSIIILEIELSEEGEDNLEYVYGFVIKYLTEYLRINK